MGVRSTAILFGIWIRPLLIACGMTFVSMLAAAGVLNCQGTPYFVISVGGTMMHLVWQFLTVDLDVPKSCWGPPPLFRVARWLTNFPQPISIATVN
jgi:4-hydroxybenzoate polyprenyltransferase